jgi:hypothetical protein
MLIRRTEHETRLEKAIDDILVQMSTISADNKEYSAMCDQLVKLYELKKIDLPQQVSPDTLVIVAGNLLGILLIVNYEKMEIMTSKALSLVLRLR